MRKGARPSVVVEHFAEQFLDLRARLAQGAPARRGGAIDAPPATVHELHTRSQIATRLEVMEHGVQCPCAQPVSVPAELVDHSEPEHRFASGVMKDVEPYQPGV